MSDVKRFEADTYFDSGEPVRRTCILATDYDDLLEFHSKTVTQYQQQCVEKDAEIARLREALADYGRHDSTCLAGQWRQGRPTSDGGYETLYGHGKDMKWYREPARPPCTCELFAALEVRDAEADFAAAYIRATQLLQSVRDKLKFDANSASGQAADIDDFLTYREEKGK